VDLDPTPSGLHPPIEVLFGRKYVIVDLHWHSGTRGSIPLDEGDDPPVYMTLSDPLYKMAPSFTEHVRGPVEGYEERLRELKERYSQRPDDPRWVWLSEMPGFDRLAAQ